MNNYQLLQRNLQDLKLTQMSLKIDEYITKINEDKISIVDALCELHPEKLKLKILMQQMQWLKWQDFRI